MQRACEFRRVTTATLLKRNWSFWTLVAVTSFCLVLMFFVTLFWLVLAKNAWDISPMDQLQRFNPTNLGIAHGKVQIIESVSRSERSRSANKQRERSQRDADMNSKIEI